jgi:hypothetical protein
MSDESAVVVPRYVKFVCTGCGRDAVHFGGIGPIDSYCCINPECQYGAQNAQRYQDRIDKRARGALRGRDREPYQPPKAAAAPIPPRKDKKEAGT